MVKKYQKNIDSENTNSLNSILEKENFHPSQNSKISIPTTAYQIKDPIKENKTITIFRVDVI